VNQHRLSARLSGGWDVPKKTGNSRRLVRLALEAGIGLWTG